MIEKSNDAPIGQSKFYTYHMIDVVILGVVVNEGVYYYEFTKADWRVFLEDQLAISKAPPIPKAIEQAFEEPSTPPLTI